MHFHVYRGKKSVCAELRPTEKKKKLSTINWQDRFGILIEIAFQVSPHCDTNLLGWSNSYTGISPSDSDGKECAYNAGDPGSIPGFRRPLE